MPLVVTLADAALNAVMVSIVPASDAVIVLPLPPNASPPVAEAVNSIVVVLPSPACSVSLAAPEMRVSKPELPTSNASPPERSSKVGSAVPPRNSAW